MPSIYDVGWLAVILLAVALALWVAFLFVATRLVFRSRQRVICPVHHRAAKVTLVRAPDGSTDDVVRCSLLEEPTVITCSKECLRPASA